jgi:hypothetical protein
MFCFVKLSFRCMTSITSSIHLRFGV